MAAFDETEHPREAAGTGKFAVKGRDESSVRLPDHRGGATGIVAVFEGDEGVPELSVAIEGDTAWLSQQQIADLFETSRTNVVEHLQHIYDEGELDREATCRDFRQVRTEGSRLVTRAIPHYDLDAILSVGYRVKSRTATRFRQWATARLREHLVAGYTLNEQRLADLNAAVRILARSEDDMARGVADVLAHYLPGLTTLREYDEGDVPTHERTEPTWTPSIDDAREIIAHLREQFPDDNLLGGERGDGLAAVVESINATWGGQDLYPSAQEKAAQLLYSTIKNHPLTDGNKRTAAALFVTFAQRNGLLAGPDGRPRISSSGLATLTLMVAASRPDERDRMLGLTMRMLEDAA